MDFTLLAQQIVNGLVAGMSYVLIATGLTLVTSGATDITAIYL